MVDIFPQHESVPNPKNKKRLHRTIPNQPSVQCHGFMRKGFHPISKQSRLSPFIIGFSKGFKAGKLEIQPNQRCFVQSFFALFWDLFLVLLPRERLKIHTRSTSAHVSNCPIKLQRMHIKKSHNYPIKCSVELQSFFFFFSQVKCRIENFTSLSSTLF